MELLKKFRIGSGLQNFHIRTPMVQSKNTHYSSGSQPGVWNKICVGPKCDFWGWKFARSWMSFFSKYQIAKSMHCYFCFTLRLPHWRWPVMWLSAHWNVSMLIIMVQLWQDFCLMLQNWKVSGVQSCWVARNRVQKTCLISSATT